MVCIVNSVLYQLDYRWKQTDTVLHILDDRYHGLTLHYSDIVQGAQIQTKRSSWATPTKYIQLNKHVTYLLHLMLTSDWLNMINLKPFRWLSWESSLSQWYTFFFFFFLSLRHSSYQSQDSNPYKMHQKLDVLVHVLSLEVVYLAIDCCKLPTLGTEVGVTNLHTVHPSTCMW